MAEEVKQNIDLAEEIYEEDESDDTETEDEEEEEPKLKYERIAGDLREILKKDGASCIAVNSKLLIIGTNWGRIHVLDHQGNKIKQFAPHSRPVTLIDMDSSGDYIASCSHDKKVVIQGLYTMDNCHSLTMDSPIRCVALDPQYGKPRSKRRFIVGDNQVTMYEKALLGQMRTTVLSTSQANGSMSSPSGMTVRAMKWGGQFLAWATDANIRVMDTNARQVISLIKRDHSLALGCDQYPPNMVWQDETTLLIGWGDSVKVCRVREREQYSTQGSAVDGANLPPFYVEIVYMFSTEFYICGIGPLDKLLVILAYNKNPDIQAQSNQTEGKKDPHTKASMEWRRPQMRVVDPLQGTYEEVSKDVLGIKCYQEYRPNNYHLAHLSEDKTFYIVCPQDVVVAKPRDADDRVQWLLMNNKYSEALEIVETHEAEVYQYTRLGVGKAYLDYLMDNKLYEEAAKLCSRILGEDKVLWEEAVVRFNRVHQLRVLSPHLPQGSLLDAPVYQTVLLDLLQFDHQGFLQVVQEWSGNLYNVSLIINSVLEELARNTNNLILLRALAHLYSNIDKHDKALAIYLKLKHTDVFGLISQHSLHSCVAKHVIELMNLDRSCTLEICSQYVHKILPEDVIKVLSNHREYLYYYLDKLHEDHRDLSAKYHNQMVLLYADYDSSKLMHLLMSSSSFDLKYALDIVKARKLNPETVYLLVRMGNSTEALNMVLFEEQDIKWAMRLCEEHSDPDLWAFLISHSLDKPEYIRELLNNMGAHVDPLMLLKSIPSKLEIPGLRDALTKIMHDYQLRYSLQCGYHRILVNDGINLLEKQVTNQNLGVPVHEDTTCPKCSKDIIDSRSVESDLAIFFCRHVYHKACLTQSGESQLHHLVVCEVCHNSQKKIFNFS